MVVRRGGNGLWQYGLVQTAQQAAIPVLYHYETFRREYLEDILVSNRVHVSNIANVNDPWDCRPWFDKDVSDSNRRAEWAALFKRRPENESEEQMQAMAALNPPWTDNASFLSRTIDGLISNVVENNLKNWRMYCLTPDPASILMWAHYSNKHAGICLEFAVAGNCFGDAQEVTYSDDFSVITPDMIGGDNEAVTEAILLTKSRHWL